MFEIHYISYKVENRGHSVTHECFRSKKKLNNFVEKDFEATLQKIRECEKYRLLDYNLSKYSTGYIRYREGDEEKEILWNWFYI